MRILFSLIFFSIAIYCFGQKNQLEAIRKHISESKNAYLKEYCDFVSIPNVLGDFLNMIRNANKIQEMLEERGVKTKLLTVDKPNSAPVVYGEVTTPGAKKTLVFYAHYDGQPVNPKQWATGLEPFIPIFTTDRLDKDGKILGKTIPSSIDEKTRLYARSSSDDKAGVFAIIAAYEALKKSGLKPTVNIKFFFEGEEEAGSTNLEQILTENKELLKSDLWLICDGPRHISGRKQIVFGVRGDINLDLKVYGAKRPLHSGNYGNWAPNPAMRLAQLLASMKDNTGRVTIERFYDDVIPFSEKERQAIKAIPDVEKILQQDLALSQPDGGGQSFMELLSLPTLNINGFQSGNIGVMASNVIPTEATAVLDLRLVKGNDVKRQIQKLKNHIEKQGYKIIDHEPTDAERVQYPFLAMLKERNLGYNAQRTSMDLPIAQNIISAIQETTQEKVVLVPSLGGSLPLYLFEEKLQTSPIVVPIVNYDNNQHAENENLLLKYLWEGIETMSAIMLMKN